jgi:hypothetical protein
VGFGSALTGNFGPVLLVPGLLVLAVTPLKAVAVSQAAQLPVVASATVGYLQAGLTDISRGTLLGIAAAAGTVTVALIATGLHPERLRQVDLNLLILRPTGGRGRWVVSRPQGISPRRTRRVLVSRRRIHSTPVHVLVLVGLRCPGARGSDDRGMSRPQQQRRVGACCPCEPSAKNTACAPLTAKE